VPLDQCRKRAAVGTLNVRAKEIGLRNMFHHPYIAARAIDMTNVTAIGPKPTNSTTSHLASPTAEEGAGLSKTDSPPLAFATLQPDRDDAEPKSEPSVKTARLRGLIASAAAAMRRGGGVESKHFDRRNG
jgi:hypothetical protein